ncbi:MAG TPA: 3D domain-containing protein [Gemmatimonadaceae bacterium]|nr:3D domain-containing protein [Gemmatimonadaceae bacterium]
MSGALSRRRARGMAVATAAMMLLLAAPTLADGATRPTAPTGPRLHAADTLPKVGARADGGGAGRRRKRRKAKRARKAPKRARVGVRVPVEITYYCLQGTTRTDRPTRDGIVAADPRVFPLRRRVELFVGGESLGRFLVDDTGALIRGHVVDVWVPSCADARQRGRRYGEAVLLERGAKAK